MNQATYIKPDQLFFILIQINQLLSTTNINKWSEPLNHIENKTYLTFAENIGFLGMNFKFVKLNEPCSSLASVYVRVCGLRICVCMGVYLFVHGCWSYQIYFTLIYLTFAVLYRMGYTGIEIANLNLHLIIKLKSLYVVFSFLSLMV